GRWLALIFGGAATLLAAGGVVEVLRWVHVLAWRITLPRERRSTWSVVGLVVGVALVLGTSAVAERARAASSRLGNEFTPLLTSAAVQVVLLAVLWFALSWALPARPCRGRRWSRERCCWRAGYWPSTWPSPFTSGRGLAAPRPLSG